MANEAEMDEREFILSPDNILSDSSLSRLKRLRSDDFEEDEFIPVTRKPKRRYRNGNNMESVESDKQWGSLPTHTRDMYEVIVTSTESLPKQMALAKMLKNLNIRDIIKIKYKGNHKVVFSFENKMRAEGLLRCEELKKKGYKFQGSDEMNFRYGIVKKVDLELEEEELKNIFECDYSEIVSILRLKRQTSEGKWVESETVRICFKGITIPPYVEAYGCRFMVEPYIFPVSQCSGCWRFGHRVKFCPTKKIFCPKCGLNHSNCETKDFKCINCKGPHMSIEKSKCPAFHREKGIRSIMSDENCSYKKAFDIYQEAEKSKLQSKDNVIVIDLESMEVTENVLEQIQSGQYRDALLSTTAINGNEDGNVYTEEFSKKEGQLKKKKQKKISNENIEIQSEIEAESSRDLQDKIINNKGDKPKKTGFSFMRIYNKLKEIIGSERSLEDKINNLLCVVFEECYTYITEVFKVEDCVGKILSIIKNG